MLTIDDDDDEDDDDDDDDDGDDDDGLLETVCWRPFPISRPKWTIIIIICCF